MSFWNDLGAWFTGRNGVYKDDDKVKQAIDDLNKVSSSIPKNLDDPLNKAITELNAVKGFSEYVGIEVPQGFFDELTVQANDGIVAMVQQIQAKKNDLDEYDNGSILEKIGGTASMTLGKVGDGFLSVFEGIGDAALTGANWIGSAATAGFEVATTDKTMADFGETFDKNLNNGPLKQAIEFDASGFLMKPLTDNELAAKYSAFTKDSGAASICKGVGKAVGYMTVAGYVSGLGQAANAATQAGNASKALKVVGALANTTKANTVVAAASGFGQGTETALVSGKTFQQATGQGAIQGAVEGGTAYIIGKIGENARVSDAKSNVEELGAKKGWSDSKIESWKARVEANIRGGKVKTGDFAGQEFVGKGGYNDSLTTAMQAKGKADMTNWINEGVVKGTGKNIAESATSVLNSVKGVPAALHKNFTDDSIIADAGNKLLHRTGDAAKHGTKLGKFASGVTRTALTPVSATGRALGSAVTTTAGTVSVAGAARVGTEAALGVGTNAVDRKLSLGINSETAHEQFQTRESTKKTIEEERNKRENPDKTPDDTPTDTNKPDEKPTDTNKSNDKTGDKTGDRTSGGPSGGSPSGGSPGTTSSDAQFKEKPTETNKTKPTETNTASNTSQNNPVPNSASNIVFNNNASNTPQTPNTPTTPNNSAPSQEIVTPADPTPQTSPANPDNPAPGATIPTGGGTSHTGGGYTDTSGYTDDGTLTGDGTSIIDDGTSIIDDDWEDASDSISSIIGGGSNFTKLPSNNPIHQSSSGSAVIPIVAGLSAAAAAGIGAKAYMDRKNNNDNGEDDFETEEWTGEDNLDIDYNDGVEEEQYLDDDSDFGTEGTVEKYGARNNDELADLQ